MEALHTLVNMNEEQLQKRIEEVVALAVSSQIQTTERHLYEIDKAVKKIAETITDLKVDMATMKVTTDKTYEQAMKTNGRVNKHDEEINANQDGVASLRTTISVAVAIFVFITPLLTWGFNRIFGQEQIQNTVRQELSAYFKDYEIQIER